MLSYLEHFDGIYHIEGGVPHLLDVMANHIKRFSGKIHVDAPVEKILTHNGVAKGVRINDKDIEYDDVIVNADMPKMVETLLDKDAQNKYTQSVVDRKKYSVSAYMLYLGVKKKLDYPMHTLVLSDDYHAYTESLKANAELTDDMSLYIYHPSALDAKFAPDNQSSLMVLAPVPNTDAAIDWDKQKTLFKTKVYDQMKKRLNFSPDDIEIEKVFTPSDWEATGVYKGATFAMKHTMNQLLHKRPHNRYEDVKNLYLVGGSTHPGSGLPIIFESAIISANLIDQRHR
jgi:phytoene desaturase